MEFQCYRQRIKMKLQTEFLIIFFHYFQRIVYPAYILGARPGSIYIMTEKQGMIRIKRRIFKLDNPGLQRLMALVDEKEAEKNKEPENQLDFFRVHVVFCYIRRRRQA